MPRYCFKDKDGNVISRWYSMDKIPQKVRLGNKVFRRDIRSEHIDTKHTPGNWPLESVAAGVAPEQIEETQQIERMHGVNTEYTRDGNAIFTSPGHRKRHLKLHRMIDRASYN